MHCNLYSQAFSRNGPNPEHPIPFSTAWSARFCRVSRGTALSDRTGKRPNFLWWASVWKQTPDQNWALLGLPTEETSGRCRLLVGTELDSSGSMVGVMEIGTRTGCTCGSGAKRYWSRASQKLKIVSGSEEPTVLHHRLGQVQIPMFGRCGRSPFGQNWQAAILDGQDVHKSLIDGGRAGLHGTATTRPPSRPSRVHRRPRPRRPVVTHPDCAPLSTTTTSVAARRGRPRLCRIPPLPPQPRPLVVDVLERRSARRQQPAPPPPLAGATRPCRPVAPRDHRHSRGTPSPMGRSHG